MNLADVIPLALAADELGYHPRHVRLLCRRGELGEKVGGRWLITRSELNEFKTRQRPGRGRPRTKGK